MQKKYVSSFIKDNFITILGGEVYVGCVLVVSLMSIICGIFSFGIGVSTRRYLPSTTRAKDRERVIIPQFIIKVFLASVFMCGALIYFVPYAEQIGLILVGALFILVALCLYIVFLYIFKAITKSGIDQIKKLLGGGLYDNYTSNGK